jgi:hypothetical protein
MLNIVFLVISGVAGVLLARYARVLAEKNNWAFVLVWLFSVCSIIIGLVLSGMLLSGDPCDRTTALRWSVGSLSYTAGILIPALIEYCSWSRLAF